MEQLTVNGKEYTILRMLGKGKITNKLIKTWIEVLIVEGRRMDSCLK